MEGQTLSNKIKTVIFRFLCILAPLTLGGVGGGCTSDWNTHYDASTTDGGTLWQAISADGNLNNFSRVLQATGYDVLLDGSQTYTVFAPTDAALSASQADSLIAEYKKQEAAGIRANDNTVVRQFLQNHIALFRHPVSSLTNDSIKLMNSKYALLTDKSLAGTDLKSTNELHNNGLLFTLDRQVAYFPNVFEYLGHDPELDSVYQFINSYSVYEFNDAKSVPGGIVDGMTIYLDSVSELHNSFLSKYGLINSEDSTYWMLCPTNSEWSRLVEEYEPYFNYPRSVAKRDSMVYATTREAIIGGAFFNRTLNPDVAFLDSAVSTQAPSAQVRQQLDQDYPYYIYFKPFAEGGIFYDTKDIVCSNGHVRKSSHWNISPYETFAQTVKVEAENILYQDTIINAVDPVIVREVTSDNQFYGKVSGNTFVEVQPETATAQVTVTFKLPNMLSNMAYDIYGVFVPATAYDPLETVEITKPNIMRPTLYYSDLNGREAQQRYNKNISNDPAKVDTVLLVNGFSFPTCSYGLSDASAKISIRSVVSAKQTATNSLTFRIDCIIVKPHALSEQ
ncbi:MAG: fasciclin domain-containing protein [Prevotella sp.]|nr:fasciclin domain-containing protein [Prevotella sp.]